MNKASASSIDSILPDDNLMMDVDEEKPDASKENEKETTNQTDDTSSNDESSSVSDEVVGNGEADGVVDNLVPGNSTIVNHNSHRDNSNRSNRLDKWQPTANSSSTSPASSSQGLKRKRASSVQICNKKRRLNDRNTPTDNSDSLSSSRQDRTSNR